MKVLLINSICGAGSTGRSVFEIAEFLNARGDECYIAHAIGSHYKNEYIIGGSLDRKLHALLSRVTGMQAVFSSYQTRKLIRFIKKHDFDVVNLNNIHSNYVNYPMLMKALIRQKRAVVLTLHDCWFYTGKCTHYTNDMCYRWQEGCGNCPRLKKDISSWFFDFTAKMLWQKKALCEMGADRTAVVGVSDWITDEAKKSVLKNSKIIRRIYNWVDTDKFRPKDNYKQLRKKYGYEELDIILLGVSAGWGRDKGLFDFVSLAKSLPEYKVVLVGEQKEDADIPDNMKIVGKTESIEELCEYYNMAECFISPSAEESFGKVVAEALSCGTPAVVYDSTASPELVEEGCGFAVPVHDTDALCRAVKRICTEGKDTYAGSCRKAAEEKFEMQKNICEYRKVFYDIAGE